MAGASNSAEFARLRTLTYLQRFLSASMPIFPMYGIMFGDRGGLSTSAISLLFAIWIAVALASELPTGTLADRCSRRTMLVISAVLEAMAFAIWLIWPNFMGFAAGFVMWGVGMAMHSGTFQAYLFDELKAIGHESAFTRLYGRSQSMALSGMVIGYLGTSIIGADNYDMLLLASIAIALAAAGVAWALPKELHQQSGRRQIGALRDGIREVRSSGILLRLVAGITVTAAVSAAMQEYVPLYYRTVGLNIDLVAPVLQVGLVLSAGVAWFAHRLEQHGLTLCILMICTAATVLFGTSYLETGAAVVGMMAFMRLILLSSLLFEAQLQHGVTGQSRATIGSLPMFLSQLLALGLVLIYGLSAHELGDKGAIRGISVVVLALGVGLGVLWWKRSRINSFAS